jgi:hypothetical protein
VRRLHALVRLGLGVGMASACGVMLTGCFSSPPQIIQLSPVNGSTGVAADAPVRVVFDHPVRRDTVEARLHIDPAIDGCDLAQAFHAEPGASCRVTWSRDSSNFTLEHARAPFAPDTKYTFALSPGVTDVSGVVNGLDHHWAITSGPPPVVNAITPSDGSSDAAVDEPVVVAFSNAMTAATAAAIQLTPAVPGTRVVRNTRDHGRFVVLPGRLLDPGATYRVTVGTTATDEHGQHLVAPLASVFHTGGLGSSGHAIVLARRDGEPASQVVLTALGAQSPGEPAAAAVVLDAPRCGPAPGSCGPVPPGSPLTAYLQAAVSPDGRWVAVVQQDLRAPSTPPAVWLVALPSLVERQIAVAGSNVSWSPDATRIAYGAPDGVHVQTILAGHDVALPPGDPLAQPARWSGDGHSLALPVQDPVTGLAHVDLADPALDARYPVPGLDGTVTDPALSPDGSTLAVRREGGADVDGTWIVRLLGGDPTPRRLGSDLTPIALVDGGTLLAAERPPDGDAGLVRVSVESGDRERLATQPLASDLSSAVVAPSGRQVAYLVPDAHAVRQALIENVDGSNPALLTTFAVGDAEAVAVSFAG